MRSVVGAIALIFGVAVVAHILFDTESFNKACNSAAEFHFSGGVSL